MNNIQIFRNNDFGIIRTVTIENEPWFVGKDVAEVLGYSDTNKAVAMHVDEEDKKLNDKSSPSFGQRGATLINESGLYSLILSSKLPNAKKFKRWVTSEVLPSIRKTGSYIAPKDYPSALRALADQYEKNHQLAQENEQMKPKAVFADAVSCSKQSILVGELAKILRQNGVQVGQNRLFKWLRENGYIVKSRGIDNYPTQRSLEGGWLEVLERTINVPDGSTRLTITPKVTGKGQVYFVNKILKEGL